MQRPVFFSTVLALSALSSAACNRSPSDGADAASARPAAPAPAASSAASGASKTSPAEDDARRVVSAWNDALDKHDIAALERVYAARVKLYGNELAKSNVVAVKKRALAAAPTFHQSIVGPIAIAKEGESFVATFTKRSGAKEMKDVAAKIVIEGGLVREESDAPTDARRAAGKTTPNACETTAESTVMGLPEVKKLIADDEKEIAKLKDGRTVGGMGPIPDDNGGISGAVGVHHAERFEAQAQWEVDRAGVLTVTVQGEDLKLPEAAKAAVKAACAKP